MSSGIATIKENLSTKLPAKRSRVIRGLCNRLPLLLVLRDDRLRENARAEKLRKREKDASFCFAFFLLCFCLRRRKAAFRFLR